MNRTAQTIIKQIVSSKPTFKTPHDAGYDAGLNGPNTNNCHFRLFATREMSDEWSRGNTAGLAAKAASKR